MKLDRVSYTGPAIDDPKLLENLPTELAELLQQTNGFIQYDGGLHVRGACHAPAWHSLRDAWLGADAFHRLYPDVTADDVPFAEDSLGDQFLLRDDIVWRLFAETGEMESLEAPLDEFLESVQKDPVEELALHPLMQFQEDGGKLPPGKLLAAYPPFCSEESADGVSLAAVPSAERRRALADLARQIRELPDGGELPFDTEH
jgi:hypothetical protein